MPWFRRAQPPAEVSALVPSGERLLAWAEVDSGGHAVATDVAVHVPERDGTSTRAGWAEVERATWQRDEGVLTLHLADTPGRPRRLVLRMSESRDLPLVLKQRVDATVVLARTVEVDGRTVRVVGRRPPRQDALVWAVTLDRGLDLEDPGVRARVEAAVDLVRSEVGDVEPT